MARKAPARGPRSLGGYMLIEASIAYVILVFAIVVMVPVFNLAIKANQTSEDALKSAELAQELMEEVKLRNWDDTAGRRGFPTAHPTVSMGPGGGEVGADKTTFDDIGDFSGWSESPPRDPLNNPMPNLAGFSRSVTVRYVDSSFNVSASTTDFKKVTVCVSKASITTVCLNWLATNY